MSTTERILRGDIDVDDMVAEEVLQLKRNLFDSADDQENAQKKFLEQSEYVVARIPQIYWNIPLDVFPDKKVQNIVEKYCLFLNQAYSHGQGIIFSGAHGTGKTLLSCYIAQRALEKGYTVRYMPFSKLIDLLFQGMRNPELLKKIYLMIERIEFLVLDDLGKEYTGVNDQLNQKVSLSVDVLLRERVNRGLVTILSTNYTQRDLKQRYGDSVFSIMSQVGRLVPVKGYDYRLIQGEQFWTKIME